MSERLPVLYLAPWVGYGGSDKNTIDWFRWLDRERFAPTLITTQPSPNPLLDQVEPYADEIWVLPDLMPAADMPRFIFDFLQSRDVRVIHLMNSRIGFDLLPDLGALPSPPSVVVQMHAEETDRSGYVRYVTTRYGDLVDCFSLSNEHVAEAVYEYGVPREKARVIYTGIDAEGEFSPDLAQPIEELPAERLQILFAARLVEQKDPLLMVDVAAALRAQGADFQIHVVGEGDLEGQIKERVAALELDDHVILHPPTAGLLRWYAACDVLLLTSTFEGVPVVIFEAMAMGLPIITPGLPAIRELLDEEDEGVVLPRDAVQGYVEPLARLAADRDHLAARAGEMRARALELFAVQQMARDHGDLYEELAAAQEGREREGESPAAAAAGSTRPEPTLLVQSAIDPSATDPAFAEKARRRFAVAGESLDAIALADAGGEGRFSFRTLPLGDSPTDVTPHTVIWRQDFEQKLPEALPAGPEAAANAVVELLAGAGAQIEWRHLAAASGEPRRFPLEAGPLPGAGTYEVPRWQQHSTWVPSFSLPAIRCRERGGSRRLIASEPPPGFDREHLLGSLRDSDFRGTAKLVRTADSYRAVPREGWQSLGEDATELGYVELAPLPGMDPLALAVHRESGEHVIVCPADDPLLAEVDLLEHLGFLDPTPLKPREIPAAQRPVGLVGLVKTLDYGARRHRYGIGAIPAGELAAELGGLMGSPRQGSISVQIVDGYLATARHRPPALRPSLRDAVRWTGAPVSWSGLASRGARAKVIARRAGTAATGLLRGSRGDGAAAGEPTGWLFEDARPGLAPLFAAYHPVTGDQLLVRHEESAAQLGYRDPQLLGYLDRAAPLTGDAEEKPLPIPWARRFGHVPRPG